MEQEQFIQTFLNDINSDRLSYPTAELRHNIFWVQWTTLCSGLLQHLAEKKRGNLAIAERWVTLAKEKTMVVKPAWLRPDSEAMLQQWVDKIKARF